MQTETYLTSSDIYEEDQFEEKKIKMISHDISSKKILNLLEHYEEYDFIYNQAEVKKEDYSYLEKLSEPKDVIIYERVRAPFNLWGETISRSPPFLSLQNERNDLFRQEDRVENNEIKENTKRDVMKTRTN
jgi:hypothetical protein